MKASRKMNGRRGWSLIELTIILIVLGILSTILAPVIGQYVAHAKLIRCREDIQALGCAAWMQIADTGNSFFMQDGATGRSAGVVNLLVSDGDVPEVGPDGDAQWAQAANLADVDFIEYHLVTNRPGNSSAHAYRTPLDLDEGPTAATADPRFARDSSGGFNSEFAWRGPYITAPIDPDPWGNRYAVNVQFLDPVADSGDTTPAANGHTEDVVVLSAGPDEEIDTAWAADGLTPGDDDMIYTLSGNSRM